MKAQPRQLASGAAVVQTPPALLVESFWSIEMTTHIIIGGVVVNTIVATVAEAQAVYPDAVCLPADTGAIGWLWDGETLAPPSGPPFDRAAAALQIDEAVAAIYGRFTRFQLEYTEREAQAQAFKDAGYTGEVPPRVAEFATPAGMPAQAATDLILAQAANLRTAQGALSALRMRKYEVLRAETDAAAQAVASEILAGVEAVGRAVQ